MKNKKKSIITLIAACVALGLLAAVLFLQGRGPLRPADLREAKPAGHIQKQEEQTEPIFVDEGKQEMKTDDLPTEQGGKGATDAGNNREDEDDKLVSTQKPDAEKKPPAPEKEPAAEEVPETDPYALKIPEELLATMDEKALQYAKMAWEKGLEKYGDQVAGYELKHYSIPEPWQIGTSSFDFAKKYGANDSIYGHFFWVVYDINGEVCRIKSYKDTFEDIDPATLEEYTEERLFEMASECLAEEKPLLAKTASYEFKNARLLRNEEGKVYLFVSLLLTITEEGPRESSYKSIYGARFEL